MVPSHHFCKNCNYLVLCSFLLIMASGDRLVHILLALKSDNYEEQMAATVRTSV